MSGGGSTEFETYRKRMHTRTPDGEHITLIVTRQSNQVWLTFGSTTKSTAVLDSEQTEYLIGLLNDAGS